VGSWRWISLFQFRRVSGLLGTDSVPNYFINLIFCWLVASHSFVSAPVSFFPQFLLNFTHHQEDHPQWLSDHPSNCWSLGSESPAFPQLRWSPMNFVVSISMGSTLKPPKPRRRRSSRKWAIRRPSRWLACTWHRRWLVVVVVKSWASHFLFPLF